MFTINKKPSRLAAMGLAVLLILSGCGAEEPASYKSPPAAEQTAGASVSGDSVSGSASELSEDRIIEMAEDITRRLSLDEKLSLMVVGYENISRMPRFFPGGTELPETTDTMIVPEVEDSLMTVREEMNELYAEKIAAGTDRIMMSLAAYPKISAMITPAFISYELVTSLLRTEMKFDGVIYTPPLTDPRLKKRYPDDTDRILVVEAVKAGCDVMYQPQDKKRAIQALRIEVNTGNMSADRIDLSVVRILESKIRRGEKLEY